MGNKEGWVHGSSLSQDEIMYFSKKIHIYLFFEIIIKILKLEFRVIICIKLLISNIFYDFEAYLKLKNLSCYKLYILYFFEKKIILLTQ